LSAGLGGTIDNSLALSDLLKRADMNVIFEFLTSSGVVLGQLATAVLILLVLHVLGSIFVFGGILNVLIPGRAEGRFSQAFFGGGGRFYGRFFRLTLYSLLLWTPAAVVFFILNAVLGVATKDPAREQLAFILNILRVVFVLFLAFFIKMIMDYARIRIATQDTNQVLQSLVEASRFVFSRPIKTLGLYYLLGLTGWAVLAVYLAVQSTYAGQSTGTIILAFMISQAFIAGRAWLKIAYQAAQKNLWELAS
jgi:hypothetical protein